MAYDEWSMEVGVSLAASMQMPFDRRPYTWEEAFKIVWDAAKADTTQPADPAVCNHEGHVTVTRHCGYCGMPVGR